MQAAERTHSPTPEDVMAHLDGEATPLSRDAMDAHLASCAICRSVADDLRGVTRATKAWSVDAAPSTLAADYTVNTDDTDDTGRRLVAWLPAWARSRAMVAGLSAAAVLLILIIPTQMPRRTAASATPPAVAAESLESSAKAYDAVAPMPAPPPPAPPAAPSALAGNARVGGAIQSPTSLPPAQRGPMIIRTAHLHIVVKAFEPVRANVETIVGQAEGFIDAMTLVANSATARALRGSLRVPSDRLPGVLASLRAIGQVVEDTQGSQDVTDQIVDLDARLASARATEQRLTELLRARTGRLSDVLDVERELARVRLDIERLDAEKTNVSRRVTYATITILIAEERKAGLDAGPLSLATRIRVATADGLEAAIGSLVGTLLFVLRAGPVLLLWGAAAAAIWIILRRAKRLRPRASE